MKLYLAGNFTITDKVEREQALKNKLGKNYNRLCTYFYPRDADVVIKGEKTDDKKEIEIKKEDLNKKTHRAISSKRKIRLRKR